jgi:hypothetical protein
MRLNGIKKFGGAILGLFLFVGIMAVSSTTAQAQYPTWNQDQYRRAERERRERELQRQRQQQQQQSGYYDQYGNWHSTGSYNNNGYYNNGYNRGRNYDGYGNQGGSYDLRQTALNAGYNEGLKAGRDDRRRGRYNPSHSINSLKDYNSRMGDRSTYQNYFMQAYQNGYADGYRGV